MTEKYSESDLKAFELKDKLNARQSALKAASTVWDGSNAEASIVVAQADIYYQWLMQDRQPPQQQQPAAKPKSAVKQRSPSPDESRLLAMLLKRYDDAKPEGTVADFMKLQKAVWARYNCYPSKESSLDKLFKEIPASEVLTKNDFVGGE